MCEQASSVVSERRGTVHVPEAEEDSETVELMETKIELVRGAGDITYELVDDEQVDRQYGGCTADGEQFSGEVGCELFVKDAVQEAEDAEQRCATEGEQVCEEEEAQTNTDGALREVVKASAVKSALNPGGEAGSTSGHG